MTRKGRAVVSSLKKAYRPCYFYKILPWELEDISVDEVFTPCLYEGTFSNGSTSILYSDQLLTDKDIRNARQVLLQGDIGTGKTYLFKHFLQQWVSGKNSDFIFIFASLRGATTDTKLIDIIERTTETQARFKVKNFKEAIKSKFCIILLDGLDEMSLDEKTGQVERVNPEPNADDRNASLYSLTAKDILCTASKNEYPNITVWITTRNAENCQKFGLHPCCKLRLIGIPDDQIARCIKKSCSHYIELAKKNCFIPSYASGNSQDDNRKGIQNVNDILPNQTSINEQEKEGLIKKSPEQSTNEGFVDSEDKIDGIVYRFLQKHDIIENLREVPQLLFLAVHITSAQFVRTKFHETETHFNIATLIEILIKCLFSKSSEVNKNQYHFEDSLRELLEQKALTLTFKNITFSENNSPITNHGQENTAIAIGILRKQPVDNSKNGVNENGTLSEARETRFSNKYFQDYFCACSIARNPKYIQFLKKNVSKCKETESFGLVKFLFNMYITPKSSLKNFCNICIDAGWFNNVIDCLYEGLDPDEEDEIITKISKKVITIGNLESNYHGSAITSFCQKCKDKKVKLKAMRFLGQCPISLLEATKLNSIKSFHLINRKFTKKEFVQLLKKVTKEGGTEELSFVKCGIEDLSSEVASINALKSSGPAVYKLRDARDAASASLNYDTGQWEFRSIGKAFSYLEP